MARTALIVIDMQTGLFDKKLMPAIAKGEEMSSASRLLMDFARDVKCTIIFTQFCAPEGGLLIEGTDRWQIHSDLTPDKSDLVVLKMGSSAFEGTDLVNILRQRNIDTVVICGLQSEFCVATTSLSALKNGFDVIVAQDCHSTVPTDELAAEIIVKQQNDLLKDKGADILSVTELTQTVFHENA